MPIWKINFCFSVLLLTKGLTLETSASLLFTVANLRFNSVVNAKLPVILSHRRINTVSLETYPLYSFAYNKVLNKVVN